MREIVTHMLFISFQKKIRDFEKISNKYPKVGTIPLEEVIRSPIVAYEE